MNQANLYTGDVEAAPPRGPRLSPPGRGSLAQRRAEYRALRQQVGARILALCTERGMTPEDLKVAAQLGWDTLLPSFTAPGPPFDGPPFTCYDFKLSTLHRIAKALGVPLAELLG